jgi:hypothetical protein
MSVRILFFHSSSEVVPDDVLKASVEKLTPKSQITERPHAMIYRICYISNQSSPPLLSWSSSRPQATSVDSSWRCSDIDTCILIEMTREDNLQLLVPRYLCTTYSHHELGSTTLSRLEWRISDILPPMSLPYSVVHTSAPDLIHARGIFLCYANLPIPLTTRDNSVAVSMFVLLDPTRLVPLSLTVLMGSVLSNVLRAEISSASRRVPDSKTRHII